VDELDTVGIVPQAFLAGEPCLKAPVRDEHGALVAPSSPPDRRALPPGYVWEPAPSGCDRCNGSGYSGRTGIYEVLPITENVRRLAIRNSDAAEIKAAAVEEGMRTLRDDGAFKVLCGITTLEEVMRVTAEEV
jgi:general secretion pathway protein E